MRESTVEEHLVEVVHACGGAIRKAQWIGRRGCPDRFVMLPKAFPEPAQQVWIELKRPGKDAEDHQRREHELMTSYGCEVYTLDTIEKIDLFFHRRLIRLKASK